MGNCRSCQWAAICAQAAHWVNISAYPRAAPDYQWAAPDFPRGQRANCSLVMLQQTMGNQFPCTITKLYVLDNGSLFTLCSCIADEEIQCIGSWQSANKKYFTGKIIDPTANPSQRKRPEKEAAAFRCFVSIERKLMIFVENMHFWLFSP